VITATPNDCVLGLMRWMRANAVYFVSWRPGSSVSRNPSTLRSATSCCAVTATLGDCSTRGVHPRCSCAARRPDRTTNSNAFMSSGRLTMQIFQHRRIGAASGPHKRQGFGEGSGQSGRRLRKAGCVSIRRFRNATAVAPLATPVDRSPDPRAIRMTRRRQRQDH
jgi:hypothetical protein